MLTYMARSGPPPPFGGGTEPLWAKSGNTLFYRTAQGVMSVPVRTGVVALEKASAIDPNDPQTHYRLFAVRLAQGDSAAAMNHESLIDVLSRLDVQSFPDGRVGWASARAHAYEVCGDEANARAYAALGEHKRAIDVLASLGVRVRRRHWLSVIVKIAAALGSIRRCARSCVWLNRRAQSYSAAARASH